MSDGPALSTPSLSSPGDAESARFDAVPDIELGTGVAAAGSAIEVPEAGAPDEDSHLPRSTSSAMPDLSSSSVPHLKARVHQRLSPDACASLQLDSLEYRALQPDDYHEVVALHTEWFPVSYDDAFYSKSVNGEIVTLAAVHAHTNGSGDDAANPAGLSSSLASSPGAASSSSSAPAQPLAGGGCQGESRPGADYDLLGIVTVSTSCEHHCEDIMNVLGSDCAANCNKACHGKDTLAESNSSGGSIAYILTLGVFEGFRRRGLARELLRRSVDHVDQNMPEVQAVYLHVVTYNEAAIQLYESMRFIRLEKFSSFYNLHGQPYDSYLYARYLHHGKPPWKVRLRNLLGFSFGLAVSGWVASAWSSMWRERKTSEVEAEDIEQMTPP